MLFLSIVSGMDPVNTSTFYLFTYQMATLLVCCEGFCWRSVGTFGVVVSSTLCSYSVHLDERKRTPFAGSFLVSTSSSFGKLRPASRGGLLSSF